MRKRMVMVLTLVLASILVLNACSNKNQSETSNTQEVSNEKITLKMAKRSFPDIAPAAKDLWMWQEYEKISNVHIDWQEIPSDQLIEKKNLMLSSGDYPETFYGYWGLSLDEIVKYGQQGIFIPLEDYIDKYAPNIKKMFDEHPEVRRAVTMPDGHIYSLPYVDFSVMDASLRYYVNKNWLKNLSLSVPTTLDEFTNVLKEFRDKDANGNGDPNDEYGYSGPPHLVGMFEQQLFGSFGMGNGGLQGVGQWIYKGDDGKLKLIFNDEKMRDVWKYMNMLWKEKLLHPETFTGLEYGNWVTLGAKDQVGAFSWVAAGYIGDKVIDNFIGINALEGPGGKVLSWVDNPARGISSFEITDKNKNPERTIQWVDYWYSEEGAKFGFLGKEGVTYNVVDGVPKYIDEITKYEGGMQLGQFQWVDNVYGGYYPYVEPDAELRRTVIGKTIAEMFGADPNDAEEHLPAERWPQFAPTAEESNESIAIMTDIGAYITESRAKFVMGKWDINGTDWDKYLDTVNKMGADRYLAIKQAQFDRYNQK